MITADKITVDDDEGRYILVIDYTGSAQPLTFDIHDIVLDFYAQVQKHVRPYVLEAEHAKMIVRTYVPPVEDTGYELDDPKHPTYHDRMTAIYDNREKT